MIAPRSTRLVRVPDLQALHRYIADSACGDPLLTRSTAVILPARGAAEELRRTIENGRLLSPFPEDGAAVALPDLVTRSELYQRLHKASPGFPRLLTDLEREVLLGRAARKAREAGVIAPFKVRAGLVVEILAFYDELRRRDRSIADFDRLITGSLEPSAAVDRGAERMLRQTRFLVAAFTEFETLVQNSGGIDEHGLRQRLVSGAARSPYRRIIAAVADQAADARGLWPADYDLLARVPALERIEIVATETMLAAGYHERVHDLLPGIEEDRFGEAVDPPALAAPRPEQDREPVEWFTCRDREDELADVVRAVKRDGAGQSLERSAVVFQRPLPYLYLARHVFAAGGVPYETLDTLPLAAEPFAAALDLVFAFIRSEANRVSLVELLGSPHWRFTGPGGELISRRHVAAAAKRLRDLKYAGGWERLASLAAEGQEDVRATGAGRNNRRALPALAAAHQAALALSPLREASSASAQFATAITFIRAHERLPQASDPWYERQLRARGALLSALDDLRAAHASYDDEPLALSDLETTIKRWIEGHTFSPRIGSGGIRLMDSSSAAFADLDEARIVGLVESDWPERSSRSIFYPHALLSHLGWHEEADRLAADRARFRDLLRVPAVRVSVSTFTLEDDAVVTGSPFLEELAASGLAVERVEPGPPARVFVHEALSQRQPAGAALGGVAAGWLRLRESRSGPDRGVFHGETGARDAAVYAVSHVERYLDCPFKYYAAYLLRLEEERDDESGLTPQERGQFLHDVFEHFFAAWNAAGRRGITSANIAEAQALFEEVAEDRLASLSESDRALERNYLLGSAAAAGLAGRAFAFEVEQGTGVVERLLEYPLQGDFAFHGAAGARRVSLRAKADRIDLLEDGTFRVIDYKLGRAPKPSRALQLPVYAVCAEQHLEGRHGRSWTFGSGGYVAFREKNAFVAFGSSSSVQEALACGQERFLNAIDGIERGTFPPRPDEPFICTRCGFSTVCRKDYVGDE